MLVTSSADIVDGSFLRSHFGVQHSRLHLLHNGQMKSSKEDILRASDESWKDLLV